ncbi:MAG: methyltransferase domain-containing protein [Phycisphaerales bacterium]|nr:methyltransferase domain-containing protein [Phycisphaerales bacterium]
MRRCLTPELMDDPALDPAEHGVALRGLARLNSLSRSDAILWPTIREAARARGGALALLDIATGSGDVPTALAARARDAGITLTLAACDTSPTALAAAQSRASARGFGLETWVQDVIREPFPRKFDVSTCGLFLHHLAEAEAIAFLRNASEATDLLLVSDLRRDPIGLGMAWAASRVVTRSRIVHVDSLKSVRAAYTPDEALRLAELAGLRGATVRTCWPRRMLLTWRRT